MDAQEIAKGLSKAQRIYLLLLQENLPDEAINDDAIDAFHHYTFRKPFGPPGLATAWALIRWGVVKVRPEPCECGWHYASLTPLGIKVRAALLKDQGDGHDHG